MGRKRQKKANCFGERACGSTGASKWSLVFTLHQVSRRHNGAFNVGWNCEVREKWVLREVDNTVQSEEEPAFPLFVAKQLFPLPMAGATAF